MNSLTDQHIEYLTQVIEESKITSDQLKADLIDHFCCAVEEDVKKGLSFKEAYDKAYHNICPDGFDEIHQETIFLLTSKNLRAMKRLLYVSGYISAIGVTTSLFMKLLHLPGTAAILLLTAAILILLFLPTLFINLYKRELTKSINEKLKYIFGFLGTTLFIAFMIFKMFHWPGTTMLFIMSVFILNFAFLPFLFIKMYKRSQA